MYLNAKRAEEIALIYENKHRIPDTGSRTNFTSGERALAWVELTIMDIIEDLKGTPIKFHTKNYYSMSCDLFVTSRPYCLIIN